MTTRENILCRILPLLAVAVLGSPIIAFTSPSKDLNVCIKKSSGAATVKSACAPSEFRFSEKSYSTGRSGVLYVAKKGAQFTSVEAALTAAGALRPSASSPIVVKVGPGTFALSRAITIPTNVILEGAGRKLTTIKTVDLGSINLSTNSSLRALKVISGFGDQEGTGVIFIPTEASGATIEDAAIELSTNGPYVSAVAVQGQNALIKRVFITNPPNSMGGSGIVAAASSVTIDDVDIDLSGKAAGISVSTGSTVTARNTRITFTSNADPYIRIGLGVFGATTKFFAEDITIRIGCSSGLLCRAVWVGSSAADVIIMNSVLESVGETTGTFFAEGGSMSQLLHTTISASGSYPPLSATGAAAIKVAGSDLSGGAVAVDGGSSITCAGVFDENFTLSASSCP